MPDTASGESLEAKQILLVFEKMISDKTTGLISESVVEGNPLKQSLRLFGKKRDAPIVNRQKSCES